MTFFEQHSKELDFSGVDSEQKYQEMKQLFDNLRIQKEPLYDRLFTVFAAYYEEIVGPRTDLKLDRRKTFTLLRHPKSRLSTAPASFSFSQSIYDPSCVGYMDFRHHTYDTFTDGIQHKDDTALSFTPAEVVQCVVSLTPPYDHDESKYEDALQMKAYFRVWFLNDFNLNKAFSDKLESLPEIRLDTFDSYGRYGFIVNIPTGETTEDVQRVGQEVLPFLSNFVFNR